MGSQGLSHKFLHTTGSLITGLCVCSHRHFKALHSARMRWTKSLLVAFAFHCQVNAQCQKDACYLAVSKQNDKAFPIAVRRADCSAVLRNYDDSDKTITITSLITVTPFTRTSFVTDATIMQTSFSTSSDISITITVETITSTLTSTIDSTTTQYVRREQPIEAARPKVTYSEVLGTTAEYNALEKRAKIVAYGQKPPYAGACKDLQSYSIACLCMGVQAQKISPRRITTLLKTISATKISMVYLTQTATITSVVTEDISTITSLETSFVTSTEVSTVTITSNTPAIATFALVVRD